jgi:hypothetical protein
MPQLRNPLQEINTPFTKMSWTPDIPVGSLQPNEYNIGLNIQTDLRGIHSVLGDEEIANSLTGTPIYITGGYRQDNYFYYIVACAEDTLEGRWYQIHFDGTSWITLNITPGYSLDPTSNLPGYDTNTNITEAWNGTSLIINDGVNPPMFLQAQATEFKSYSLTQDVTIYNVVPYSSTTMLFETNEYLPDINVPYTAGDTITVSDVVYPTAINGSYTILSMYPISSYTMEAAIPESLFAAKFEADISGYTMTVTTLYTGTINVGDYVCAPGILYGTYVYADLGGGVYDLDQSQTIATVDMATIPAYTSGGIIRPEYQWNYNPDWTALSAQFLRCYSSPNVGSILIAGNLTATDVNTVTSQYPNTVRWSQQFGLDSVPEIWAPTVLNIANELEVPLRGSVVDGFPCNGNFFVCSYWDTVVFAPINYQTTQIPILGCKLFNQGRGLLNSNCWVNADDTVFGLDARDLWQFNGQDFRPLGNQRIKDYFFDNLHPAYTNQVFLEFNAYYNQVEIYYPDLESTGFCNKMISYRVDLDVFNPPRVVPDVIMATEGPIYRDMLVPPFTGVDYASRCVLYVRAVSGSRIVQKDQGYTFIDNTPIDSVFQRGMIRLVEDYSNKTMVHRIMPQVVTVNNYLQTVASEGSIDVEVGGNNSAGQAVTFKPLQSMLIDTDQPWVQIDQNAYRQNTLRITRTGSVLKPWMLTGATWQFTPVEDDR